MWHANFNDAAMAGDLFRIDPIIHWCGLKMQRAAPPAAKVCGKCTSGDGSKRARAQNLLFRSFSNYAAFHYAHTHRKRQTGKKRTL